MHCVDGTGSSRSALRVVLALAVALSLAAPLLSQTASQNGAFAQDMGTPAYANRMVELASGPVLEPGEGGDFHLKMRNPSQTGDMNNITLRLSIYLYRSLEKQMDVGEMGRPPVFVNSGETGYDIPMFSLSANSTSSFVIRIDTWESTPHPGYFDQGAYFIRLWMRFEHAGETFTLFSRGHFSDGQWDSYVQAANVSQQAGVDYLHSIGCDGIIPDTSFTVRLKIPLWPLAVLVFATVGTGMLALMYYLEENPGTSPRLEKAFQGARGKAKQAWAFCKQSLRKP
ncbi:MAG: hypothetical protein V1934_06020 [Methanobacteriota archaeon]